MSPENVELLDSLRRHFARSAGGNVSARTATFINANLDTLGIREWMEAYSINGSDWTLKRMVLHPDDAGGVIHQHTQQQYSNLNFGEAIYRLAEYEEAQAALGYIPDADDSGQITGAPLFRDVAKTEGIPHNTDGRLVVPQQGHIVEDGAYPANAFAIAAIGQVKNKLPVVQSAGGLVPFGAERLLQQQAEHGVYTISIEAKNSIRHQNSKLKESLDMVRALDLNTLLNSRGWSFRYLSNYNFVMDCSYKYEAGNAPSKFESDCTSVRDLPLKLLAYIRYQFVSVDVASREIMVSSMMKQKEAMLLSGSKVKIGPHTTLFNATIDMRLASREFKAFFRGNGQDGLDDNELNMIELRRLTNLDVEEAYERIGNTIDLLDDIVRSVSVDLSALPELPIVKKSERTELSLQKARELARPANTGPR